jgi:HK97 family phage prohead protease
MTTTHYVRRRLAQTTTPARLEPLGKYAFEGYASLFNVPDNAGDIVAPGAFAASLRQRSAPAVRMLYQHFAHEPIGVWDVIKEDARGLFVRGHITADVERARDVAALIRDGAVNGLSIGFRTKRATRNPNSTRTLTEIELWEISVVTFPMLPQSQVTAIGGRSQLVEQLRVAAAAFKSPANSELRVANGG